MLSNKIVVITGGAGLLGQSFCTAVAEQGGLAVVADIDLAAAERVSERIVAAGGRADPAALDITDAASLDVLIASVHARHGHIDAVVNNAYPRNKSWGRKLEDVSYADFCENVSLHLGGYFLVAQKFAKYFSEHGGGSIVNMGSIYGTVAPRFELYAGTSMTLPVEYAAIKAGIIQLTRYFAQYFKGKGVRCNSLSPGGIFDHQPEAFLKQYNSHCGTKGMLEPQDIAGALIFLLSDAARSVTGQNMIVDDGFGL